MIPAPTAHDGNPGRGCVRGCADSFLLFVVVVLGSVLAYVTIQRGPLHALDCWVTDDIAVEYAKPGMTLGEFRQSVRTETRNCVSINVVEGPDSGDAIVLSPVGQRTILYRPDRTIDVWTSAPRG